MSREHPSELKVYVMLGLHTSFHHSWRGDTPDEAGFGTDIRVVRRILQTLDQAERAGRRVRAYWDFDVYWTLQEIIPRHAPDIIQGIRQRVVAGRDEIVVGPYNNGANHAATERELRAAIAYAFENPFGSGLRQVFGQVSTVYRPQESMYTAGQNPIFLEEGVSGLVLYYAGVPFNALSTFLPALPPAQRYNPLWLRAQADEPPLVLWPCISPPDLIEHVSLEALLLGLRRLQTSGRVGCDLLVHLNFDADAETWLPVDIPRAFAWFPNTGGLVEYIDVVNRYPWAAFTVPSDYARQHPPQGEVLVRQDLADGGFDGNYSWAEKYTSLRNWTVLEGSRLHTYRTEALARHLPGSLAEGLRQSLWDGPDSPFFRRLIGLTTTHFGMSTPAINEERQAKAEALLGKARDLAAALEREAALAVRAQGYGTQTGTVLYDFEVYRPVVEGQDDGTGATSSVQAMVRVPLVLPPGVGSIAVEAENSRPVAGSLVNSQRLRDGRRAGELMLVAEAGLRAPERYRVYASEEVSPNPEPQRRLQNRWLDLRLSEETGIAALAFKGQQVGGSGFLAPFITYRRGRKPQQWRPAAYRLERLEGEQWQGMARTRLSTEIVMDTPHGPTASALCYTFTLFDDVPYLLLDVDVDYARTVAEDVIQTVQQRLRHLLDLRWVEVAPCQLEPEIRGSTEQPLRVWKHNHLGVTSYYDLDYGRVNRRNRELDSFNHQVTAGWVAVSDGRLGLLLAESAEVLASMAFCPMRLRERQGLQRLSLNPFGSYHGRQLDYGHLGGNRLGAAFTAAASGSLRPNGPSFNGQRLAFSLLLAPYAGDQPPAQVQQDALLHFYPPGVLYRHAPADLEAVVPDDVRRLVEADRRAQRREGLSHLPLEAPSAFVANPTERAVDLVWEPPADARLSGYEVCWCLGGEAGWRDRAARDWQCRRIPPGRRWQVPGLQNGRAYRFRMRSLAEDRCSAWTAEAEAVPGAIGPTSLLSMMPAASVWSLLRLVACSLAAVVRARLLGR